MRLLPERRQKKNPKELYTSPAPTPARAACQGSNPFCALLEFAVCIARLRSLRTWSSLHWTGSAHHAHSKCFVIANAPKGKAASISPQSWTNSLAPPGRLPRYHESRGGRRGTLAHY